jgi:hypothetical protein
MESAAFVNRWRIHPDFVGAFMLCLCFTRCECDGLVNAVTIFMAWHASLDLPRLLTELDALLCSCQSLIGCNPFCWRWLLFLCTVSHGLEQGRSGAPKLDRLTL